MYLNIHNLQMISRRPLIERCSQCASVSSRSGEGTQHPFRNWSTADITGDDKDDDSEGLSKDPQVFQDTACRGQTWQGGSHTADRQRPETYCHECGQGSIFACLLVGHKIACL